ncbi:toll-like receptor [Pimephales promelas]|nr:toll-like receptor [Pimephales promelas]
MILSYRELMIFLSSILILVNAGEGQECTTIIKNMEYSCFGRNLTHIPSSIPLTVTSLDFSFNFLNSLHKCVFPVLFNLQVLDLTRCHIEHIENDTFYNVKNLTKLILTGNPIAYFGPGCLNSLHNLQRLVLVDVGLASLQLQMNNLTKLRELRVGTNGIHYDEVWVMNELMENLENGVPPIHLCLHMRDFQPGKSIASNIIDEGIMGSRKVIVVVSQHFIDSAWCRFEFELAQSRFMMERNANIIIVILEDVEETKTKKVFGLHKHLKKNTYLKWSRDPLSNMRFWIRLRRAIINQ